MLKDEYLNDDFILSSAISLNHGFAEHKIPIYAVCSTKPKAGNLQMAFRRYNDGCTGYVNARYISEKDVIKYLEKNKFPKLETLKKSTSQAQPEIKAQCKIAKPINSKELLHKNEANDFSKMKQKKKQGLIVYGDKFELHTGSEKINAQYGLIELNDLQASHLFSNFSKNPKYPVDCQERDYHEDTSAQSNVINVAKDLEPKYLLIDSPDSINGSPIITAKGIVLGGNGRTMSLQRANLSFPEKFEKYEDLLHQNCRLSLFGLTTSDLTLFKKPVLVRVIDIDMNKCSTWSWKLNTGTQKEQTVKSRAIAYSKDLDQSDLNSIAEVLQNSEAESFADIKNDTNTVKELIRILRRAGIITETTVNNWLDEPDEFSQNGLMYLETMLLGAILKDKELISYAKNYSAKILKSLAYFLRLKKLQGKWNLLKYFQEAIKAEHERMQKGFTKGDVIKQTSAFDKGLDKNTIAAWNVLDLKTIEFKKVMERITIAAENEANDEDGTAMFGEKTEPDEVMNKFLNKANDGTLKDYWSEIKSALKSDEPNKKYISKEATNPYFEELYYKFNTKELIKRINQKYKGKIEGSSTTTSSIYSKILSNKYRVRVSKHDIYIERSKADFNIFLDFRSKQFYVNERKILITNKTTIETLYSFTLKTMDLELNELDENWKDLNKTSIFRRSKF